MEHSRGIELLSDDFNQHFLRKPQRCRTGAEEETMNVGERIRQRREALGLTLEAVANELGVNRSTVKRYESGETQRIPLSTIEKLARVLRTTTAYLMGWEGVRTGDELPQDEDIRMVVSAMRTLSADDKKILLKIVRAMSHIADEELKRP